MKQYKIYRYIIKNGKKEQLFITMIVAKNEYQAINKAIYMNSFLKPYKEVLFALSEV